MNSEALAKNVKLLILDVDGVLTNGQIIFGRDGELMKEFHAQDGMGITLAHKAGIKVAIITGRDSQMVTLRSAELGITDIYQGAMSKTQALAELMDKYKVRAEEIAYIGDDLNDLPVMIRIGLPCAVANAVPEVKEHARFVTSHAGGNGAVREVIEYILKAQDKWASILACYLQGGYIETKQ
jgi:3-deoxy-D-manno-octulosonate 8-phosphate phosphatase (KDO 8-P phosphatase)